LVSQTSIEVSTAGYFRPHFFWDMMSCLIRPPDPWR